MSFEKIPDSNAAQDPVDGARAALWTNKERETWISLDWGPLKGFQLFIDRELAADAYVINGFRPNLLLDARMIAGQFSFRGMTDRDLNTQVVSKAVAGMASLNGANPIRENPIFYSNYAEVLAGGDCPIRFDMPSNIELFHLTK